MEAQAGDGDGSAGLVVAGIINVLDVEGREEAAPQVRGVKALEDFLRAVGQGAVAEQETQPAEGQILLVSRHDSVGDERDAGAVVAPIPECSLRETAEFEGAIVLGISERFVAAIAPAETPEDADIWI